MKTPSELFESFWESLVSKFPLTTSKGYIKNLVSLAYMEGVVRGLKFEASPFLSEAHEDAEKEAVRLAEEEDKNNH